MLLELGIVGLWLLVVLMVTAFLWSLRISNRATTSRDSALALGIAATVAAAAANSFVSTYLEIFPMDVLFWLSLGVLRACRCADRLAQRSRTPPRRQRSPSLVRELVRVLSGFDDLRLVAAVQKDAASELPPSVTLVSRRPSDGARRALESMRSARGADLVHGLDIDLPWRSAAPTVTTVHDMSVFDVPWAFSRSRATAERALIRRALRAADAIVCVSASLLDGSPRSPGDTARLPTSRLPRRTHVPIRGRRRGSIR